MGLDMYLDVSVYLSKYSSDETMLKQRETIQDMFPEIRLTNNLDYAVVTFEAGHWRKANAIHRWFVENVQDGEDECRPHTVSREDLEQLRDTCKEVKQSPGLAEELIPTQDGFCFGGMEYGDLYFEDIDATIEIVEYALSLPEKYSFEYHSSW